MPLTLKPINRRRFLTSAILGGTGLFLSRSLFSAEAKTDANHFVLFSDIHLHANKSFIHDQGNGATNMWANFKQACEEALALPTRPACVLINGDIAFHKGLVEDYATAIEAMKPLREAGLTVHWALGNHDDRNNVSATMPDENAIKELSGRRVMMISSPRANIFILDSLRITDNTPGLLGDEQLTWLAGALDRHADTPAIVFVHHQPYLGTPEMGDGTDLQDYVHSQKFLEQSALKKVDAATDGSYAAASKTSTAPPNTALLDTLPLLNVLLPRKQVKAYFFGHTHVYSHKMIEGMHLINLPATGWVFDKRQPLGWTDMHLEKNRAGLQLNCLNHKHPLQHDRLDIQWR
jgi:3',5'-cyclic-AMP phosphodiesterase